MREVVAIYGGTGCGKSTKLGELIAPYSHAVAVDPWAEKTDWRRRGYEKIGDLPALSKALAQNWRTGFRYVITPPPKKAALALDGVSNLLFGYSQRVKLPRVALAVDEMANCYSNAHAKTASLTGFELVLLQGRHLNISIYGVTQFPADVAAQFRAMAYRRFIFALYDATATDTILASIGRDKAPMIPLSDYDYLEWNRGQIKKGRTKA